MATVRQLPLCKRTIKQLTEYASQHHISIPHCLRLKLARRQYLAATLIQHWYRRYKAENHVDFVSWEPLTGIPRAKLFHFYDYASTPAKLYLFLPMSLYNYFLQSGKFQNPFTRTTFREADLFCLFRMLLKQGMTQVRPLHLQYRVMMEEAEQLSQLEQTLSFLGQEAISGLSIVWENPAPLPMTYYLFQTCEILIPTFINRLEEMRLLNQNYVRHLLRRVLQTLHAKVSELTMSSRILDMNRRTLCQTCYDILQSYRRAAFHES